VAARRISLWQLLVQEARVVVETVLRPPRFSLAGLWRSVIVLTHYRDLLVVLTMHRIKVRYKQSALGPVWAVVQPLAMMVVFAAVFSVITRVPAGPYPYAVFAYAGLLPWTAFAAALSSASVSMVSHASLVTRVAFPREILPLTYVAAALFDLAIASTVLAAMMAYYGIALTPAALWVLPIMAVLAAFTTAVSLALCAVNVRFRDIGVGMPLLLQFWMFASPVIYPLDAVPAEWRRLYLLNPLAGFVDGFRRAVLDGRAPDAESLATAIIVTLIALPLAYGWFKHVDATMADVV
jgi:lipopolysaccharide transport system permease protein